MRNRWSFFVLVTIVSVILAACGGGNDTAGTDTDPVADTNAVAPVEVATDAPAEAAPTEAMAEEAPTEAMAEDATTEPEEPAAGAAMGGDIESLKAMAADVGPELEAALNGEYDGTVVSMLGPIVDTDQVKFENTIKSFEDATGIDIQYEGTKEFETIISVRVDGGTAPDIADFPQPGLMGTFAAQGQVQDVTSWFPNGWLEQNYNQGYIDTATVQGPNGPIVGGVFHRVFPKSLVFYPKQAWDQAQYPIPETWDQMIEVMDDIVADGDAPWCIGIESGTATGWPATDWMEEVMLRTTSLENYDAWTTGELPFTSPEVKSAAERVGEIWLNPDYVYGGTQNIVTTNFGDAPTPMFDSPPKCWMHKQGAFIISFFPEGVEAGVDYDFFYFPPIDEQYGKPVLFSGDLMTPFSDRPEVKAVTQFFATFSSVRDWAASGGALSPHNDADVSVYGNEVDQKIANILADADTVRFDGSDLMPGAVGAGTFWKGMTDWVSGAANLDQALDEAQQGWNNIQQ